MSTGQSWNISIEDELERAPLEDCHRDLIMNHFHRLKHTLQEQDEANLGNYTNKQAALEQLARMTLVIRDYVAAKKRAEERGQSIEDTTESMVADVMDASLFTGGLPDSFAQPMFVNSTLWGREQEIAMLMQEIRAESADDVIELWNYEPAMTNKVLPDAGGADDLGKEIDWNKMLLRSRSEGDILHRHAHLTVEDVCTWQQRLQQRKPEELTFVWPPGSPRAKSRSRRRRKRHNTVTRKWLEKRLTSSLDKVKSPSTASPPSLSNVTDIVA